jgi:hypothetical protein
MSGIFLAAGDLAMDRDDYDEIVRRDPGQLSAPPTSSSVSSRPALPPKAFDSPRRRHAVLGWAGRRARALKQAGFDIISMAGTTASTGAMRPSSRPGRISRRRG